MQIAAQVAHSTDTIEPPRIRRRASVLGCAGAARSFRDPCRCAPRTYRSSRSADPARARARRGRGARVTSQSRGQSSRNRSTRMMSLARHARPCSFSSMRRPTFQGRVTRAPPHAGPPRWTAVEWFGRLHTSKPRLGASRSARADVDLGVPDTEVYQMKLIEKNPRSVGTGPSRRAWRKPPSKRSKLSKRIC